MNEVAVVSSVRTPFGSFGGTLRDLSLPELGGPVFAEAVRRAGVAPEDVEEQVVGQERPAEFRRGDCALDPAEMRVAAGLLDAGAHFVEE